MGTVCPRGARGLEVRPCESCLGGGEQAKKRSLTRNQICQHLNPGLPVSKMVRKEISHLRHQVCVILSLQPLQTNTGSTQAFLWLGLRTGTTSLELHYLDKTKSQVQLSWEVALRISVDTEKAKLWPYLQSHLNGKKTYRIKIYINAEFIGYFTIEMFSPKHISLWCEWNWPADVHPMVCTTKICPPVPRRSQSIAWTIVPWRMTRMWEKWCFSNESDRISLAQFSHAVMSDSLWPHGLQHTRPSCPSPTPGVYSNSSPFSQWCHPTISSSIVPFSSRLRSFLASESFQKSQLFPSGGLNIGVSASASVLPMNIQDWFLLRWTYWISLQSKRFSRVFSNTPVQKHQFFSTQLSL